MLHPGKKKGHPQCDRKIDLKIKNYQEILVSLGKYGTLCGEVKAWAGEGWKQLCVTEGSLAQSRNSFPEQQWGELGFQPVSHALPRQSLSVGLYGPKQV